jgi:hypothetical protein
MATDTGSGARNGPCAAPSKRRSRETSLFRLFLGGITGTVGLALIEVLAVPLVTGRPSPFADILGTRVDNPHGVGLIVFHCFNGSVVFPMGFAFLSARLPGPWIVKGLIWGAILWLLAEVAIMPMAGYGFFGRGAGIPGSVLSALVGLLAYGGLQGAMAALPGRKDD